MRMASAVRVVRDCTVGHVRPARRRGAGLHLRGVQPWRVRYVVVQKFGCVAGCSSEATQRREHFVARGLRVLKRERRRHAQGDASFLVRVSAGGPFDRRQHEVPLHVRRGGASGRGAAHTSLVQQFDDAPALESMRWREVVVREAFFDVEVRVVRANAAIRHDEPTSAVADCGCVGGRRGHRRRVQCCEAVEVPKR